MKTPLRIKNQFADSRANSQIREPIRHSRVNTEVLSAPAVERTGHAAVGTERTK